MIIPVRCFTCGKVRVVAFDSLSVLFVFCILRGLFFFTASSSFVRSGEGGDFRIERMSREREPQKLRCDVSIDRFAKLFSSLFCDDGKEERPNRSIDGRRSSRTRRRRGLVLPVAWSFLEWWSDAISFSLSPLKSKR